MRTVRLFAHAIVLAAWAAVWQFAQPDPTPGLIAFTLVTVCVASVIAERERSRRRRAQSES